MKALVDTSSFVALARYYLPFDTSGVLSGLVEEKCKSGEILLLDAIYDECRTHAKGMVVSSMPYLAEKERIVSTNNLIPTKKFLNMLEHQFCDQSVRSIRQINDAEFEVHKAAHLESGDGKLLLFALLANDPELIIVTEETASANDNKLFKKIPACCRELEIPCVTLPQFITQSFGTDLGALLSGK